MANIFSFCQKKLYFVKKYRPFPLAKVEEILYNRCRSGEKWWKVDGFSKKPPVFPYKHYQR